MSKWGNKFDELKIKSKIEAIVDRVKEASPSTSSELGRDEFTRLVKAVRVIQAALTSVDPDLMTMGTIESIGHHLDNLEGSIVKYKRVGMDAPIVQANSHADEILNLIRRPHFLQADEIQAIRESERDVVNLSIDATIKLESLVDNLKKKIENYDTNVGHFEGTIGQMRSEIQNQVSRLDVAISSYHKRFAEFQDSREKVFSEKIAKWTEDLQSSALDLKAKLESSYSDRFGVIDREIDQIRSKSSEHAEFIVRSQDKVNAILGAIGQAALSGHHEKTADRELKSANIMRLLAIETSEQTPHSSFFQLQPS